MPLERCCETIKPSRLWNIRLTLRQGASRRNRRPRLGPNTGMPVSSPIPNSVQLFSHSYPHPSQAHQKMGCPKCGHDEYVSSSFSSSLCSPGPAGRGFGWSRTRAYSPVSPSVPLPPQRGVLPGPVEAEADAHDPLLRLHKMQQKLTLIQTS